jgi:tetratricopeptide (TPR) repeat protein
MSHDILVAVRSLWRLNLFSAAVLIVFGGILTLSAQGVQHPLVWDHGTHTQPSPDERALREWLGRYSRGEIDGPVRAVLTYAPAVLSGAVDDAVRRAEEEIKYHRRYAQELGTAQHQRLQRYLRADRLNVLLRAAALQLDAARAAGRADISGGHVVASERTIEKVYALRPDFEQNGPLPWPIDIDERWVNDAPDDAGPDQVVDWPSVRDFTCRWYRAAVSRLQGLAELKFAPTLVAKGLARCPGDPDLLLARGSLVEMRLALEQVDASLASVLYTSGSRERWREWLTQAERDYEQAVQTVGVTSEAAVRLARVRLLQGQRERAREVLDRVLAADAAADLRYLALVFRAAGAEQSGDIQAATRDYEAALAAVPDGLAPMLALARIADEQQRSADARTWIERATTTTSDTRALDPWHRYAHGQAWQLADRVASLRTLPPH